MRGGSLPNVIRFQEPIETRTNGVPAVKWEDRNQAFCGLKTRNARKFTETGQNFERQVHEFFCRFFDAVGVQQNWRIKFNGKLYQITGINPDHDRSDFIKIETEYFNETSRS